MDAVTSRGDGTWLVLHGSYGSITPYRVVQHEYGCTDCESTRQGYVEVLEFVDRPEGRPAAVLYNQLDHVVYEFESVEAALEGMRVLRWHPDFRTDPKVRKVKGCSGVFALDKDQFPWFYPEEHNGSD